MIPVPQIAGLVGMLGRSALGLGAGRAPQGTALDWRALPLPSLGGGELDPALFVGRVVLAVNTASRCGFTPQYAGLQRLWEDWRDDGLTVLGIPSNDFAGQEPGSPDSILRFCEERYGVDFPLLAKQSVRGDSAHPLYRWAEAQAGSHALPAWNFHKLLIGRDGRLLGWFTPAVRPSSPRLARALEAALAPG